MPAQAKVGSGLGDDATRAFQRGDDSCAVRLFRWRGGTYRYAWQIEVGRFDARTLREQAGALDHVAQLAHVARPVMLLQCLRRLR